MGDDHLARLAEMAKGGAHLVGGGGRHAPFGQAHQEGLHMRVGFGGAQRLGNLCDRQAMTTQKCKW